MYRHISCSYSNALDEKVPFLQQHIDNSKFAKINAHFLGIFTSLVYRHHRHSTNKVTILVTINIEAS